MTHQPSFAHAEFAAKKKITRREKFLTRMDAVIPWVPLLAVITPLIRQHDGQGASRRHWGFKKSGPQAIGRSRGGLTTKIHLVAAQARCALNFSLSPGQAGDAPQGRELLWAGGPAPAGCQLLMDRAYEGDETRALGVKLGYLPVVPSHPHRRLPWE